MTQQTPETGTTPPQNPPTENPPEDAAPDVYTPTLPPENKGSGRFAVYDKTLERYVGTVQDSKPTSTDARKLTGDHGYAIREV